MQNIKPLILFLFISLISVSSIIGQTIRKPVLNYDATAIAFSYQGDIWVCDIDGENAKRLTIHDAYESQPQWDYASKKILFTANRFGDNDLFVTDITGKTPERLTWHSSNDSSPKWGIDGIYFQSRRVYAQVEWDSEMFILKDGNKTEQRLLDALGTNPTPSPDGRYIAYEKGSCRVSREAYRGPASRDIWVYDSKKNEYKQISMDAGQDVYPDWTVARRLFYLSAKSGRYNIVSTDLKTGKITEHTNVKEEGIRWFDVNAGGHKAIYCIGEKVYLLDIASGASKVIDIKVGGDYHFEPVETKEFNSDANDYALSPNEKMIALNVHGEIIVKANDKEKSRATVMTKSAARDQQPQWLNDETVMYISDESGNYEIHSISSSDTMASNLTKAFSFEKKNVTNSADDEDGFIISPDKKKIAITTRGGKFMVADIDSTGALTNSKTLMQGWNAVSDLSWSPDSRWLAYSQEDLYFNSEVFIIDATSEMKPVNVSMHPRVDRGPVWSKDGTKLGFISNRNNDDYDIWYVWLKKADWQKTKDDWDEEDEDKDEPKKEEKKEDKDGEKDKEKKEELKIEIDFKDIHDRTKQLTYNPGDEYGLMISEDGKTFYYITTRPGQKSPSLMKVEWDGSKNEVVKDGIRMSNLQWDKKMKNIYYLSRGSMSKLNVSNKKTENLPFSAKLTINHKKEREQVFEDAWKALNYKFYDPDFHGKDWTKLKEKYKPRAINATTVQDFRFFVNQMLGQLNASHMGIYGSNPKMDVNDKTGYLGIEGEMKADGYHITYILPNAPADRANSQLKIGDVITAINGASLSMNNNMYELLNNTRDERTLLHVISDKEEKAIVIRPSSSVRSQRYEAWVESRKALTEKYSNGRLGYIHIQAMGWSSFERFQRELMASGYGKEGIVIDVRFNGGGWTTDMLMAVLNVRQHAYTIPRGAANSLEKEHTKFKAYYPYGERLPFPPLMKPSIAMCNQNSYSNAEIFSHAYKTLNIGTLVGQPTFGAVISTGGYGLMDGSYVRMPFRAWYVKATNENMEGVPATPDILVENAPNEKGKGIDTQLKTAVDELLRQIDEGK